MSYEWQKTVFHKGFRVSWHDYLWEKQKGKCHYCPIIMIKGMDKKRSITIEHKIPRSRGGKTHKANLVGACGACNRHKGMLTDEEYRVLLTLYNDRRQAPRCDSTIRFMRVLKKKFGEASQQYTYFYDRLALVPAFHQGQQTTYAAFKMQREIDGRFD